MIRVDMALDGEGILISCDVQGHAGAGKPGNDVVCAAVSVLTRTLLLTLSGKEGVDLRSEAPHPGLFHAETSWSGDGKAFLAGAGSFLIEGLSSVAELYPEFCVVTKHTERRN